MSDSRSGVVAFAFGAPDSIYSNYIIGVIAAMKAEECGASIYTQADICIEAVFSSIEVEYTEEELGNPPPTLRIARGAVLWAKKHGVRELWIAAAKPHLWRCVRDLKYATREASEAITVYVCERVESSREDEDWFCPDSTQERTRSREAWEKRERIVRWMPMWLYKRVAS